jgi:hypothetical protein
MTGAGFRLDPHRGGHLPPGNAARALRALGWSPRLPNGHR